MKTFLLLIALCTIAYSGQIYQWSDAYVSNHQTDQPPNITLYFNLESSLKSFSYLRLQLPFTFSGSPTVNVFAPSSRCGDQNLALGPVVASGSLAISAISGDTNAFFVQLNTDLAKGTNYALNFAPNAAISGAAVGLSGTIGIMTTTDNLVNYMIIDQNPHFASFEWVAPAAALVLADNVADAAGNSSATNSLGITYGYNFSFTPTQAYVGGAVAVISLVNPKFQVASNPQCVVTLANGVVSNYSCNNQVPGVTNVLQVMIPDYVSNQKVYVYFKVTNPVIADSSDVKVVLKRMFNGQNLEQATGSGWLLSQFTTAWNSTTSGFQVSWGASISALSNHPLRVYKNTANTAYYQSIRFVMQPTVAVPQGYKLRLWIDLGDQGASEANYALADSSISHNLDPHDSNARVICEVTGTTAKKIRCENVNLASSAKAYYVSIKIRVKTTLGAAFGTATLEARMQPDGSSPSSTLNLVSALVGTVPTPTVIDDTWDPTLPTTPSGLALPVSTDIVGVLPKMYFDSAITTRHLKIWASSSSLSATSSIGQTVTAGFDVYVNKYVTSTTPIAGTIGLYAANYVEADSATPYTYGDYYASSASQPYNRIRGGFATVPTLASGAAGNAWYLKFNNVTLLRGPSIRADEASWEMYIGVISNYTVNGTADASLAWTKPGFISFQSITGPAASPANPFLTLGGGVVAAYTGDTSSRYPALLRIAGALSATEATSTTTRLVVFFQNIAPYAANKYNDYTSNCSGSSGANAGTGLSCIYYPGKTLAAAAADANEVVGLPRLEITWPGIFNGTTNFQILIPVIPVADITNIFFATMDNTANTPLRLREFGSPISADSIVAAPTVSYGVSGNVARFIPTATDKVGASVNNSLKIATTDATLSTTWGTSVNSYTSGAVKVNAGFQFCGSYNFLAASAAFGTNALGNTNYEDKCLTYSVAISSAAALGTNKIASFQAGDTWCVFCPAAQTTALSSGVNVVPVTNFKLWSQGVSWVKQSTAITPSPTVGCLFLNDGTAHFCDDGYDTTAAGVINATFNPATMTTTTSNMKLTIGLSLTNPLPVSTSSGIYLRFTASVFTQESGADCRISFGGSADSACTFTASYTTGTQDAAETTSGVSPASITGYTVPASAASATNVVITLYGIKTPLTAATSSSITVSTRSISGSTGNTWSTPIDLQTTATVFNVTVAAASTVVPTLTPIQYGFAQRGARSTLQIGFKPASGRDIYRKERFVIQWNSANYTTAPNTIASSTAPGVFCEVYDSNTNEFLALFKSCAIDSSAITLIAHSNQDISMSTFTPVIYVRSYTAIDATGLSLGAQLQAVGGNTVIQQTASPATGNIVNSVASTALAFATGDITVQRIINQVGLTSELQFTIKNSAGAVGPAWRLVIDFPNYYSPRLANVRNLLVLVNNNSANAEITDHRQLTIRLPNIAIANGSTIAVRIVGIAHPKTAATAGTFWFGLDSDTNSDAFAQAGTVADQASAIDTTNSIWLYNASISSTGDLRNGATWTWSLIPRVALTAGNVLVLSHSDSWTDALAVSALKGMTCSATAGVWNNSIIQNITTIGAFWTTYGNRVKINITAAVAANSAMNVTCSNVRLPDNVLMSSGCLSETPSFIAVDANESAVIASSASASAHIMRNLNLTSIPSLAALGWSGQAITIIQGTTLPQPVQLAAPGGAFVRSLSLTLNPTNPNITITPAQPAAVVGDRGIGFVLSASNTAPLGMNYLLFSKTENSLTSGPSSDAYSPLPPLKVQVRNQKVAITNPAAFSVPVGGKSVPIRYSWALPPQADVTVAFACNDSAITFSPATASLDPKKNSVSIVLSVPSSATVGTIYNISISSVTGTNAPAFTPISLSSTIVLFTAAAAQTDSPTISLTLDTTSASNSATKQSIAYTISSTAAATQTTIPPVSVFWNCMFTAAGMTRDLSAVQAQAGPPENGGQAPTNGSELNGEISGTFIVLSPSTNTDKLLISGLRANTSYSCRFWAVNQVGNNASNTTTFTTASNGGKLLKVKFNFDASKYTATSTQNLLCWLSQTFAVNPMAIRSIYNEYCGSTANIQVPYNNTYNQTELNLTAVQVPFFFLPNLRAEQDNFYVQVQSAITNPAWVTALKSSGFGILGVGGNNISIPQIPALTGDTAANISGGGSLSGYSLNTSGYIYAVVVANDSAVPNINDILKGRGANGVAPIAAQADYNDGGNLTRGSMIFSNLTATSYNLYWAATCDDPSENAIGCATSVRSAILSPGAPTVIDNGGGSGSTNAKALSFGIGLISLIICLILG